MLTNNCAAACWSLRTRRRVRKSNWLCGLAQPGSEARRHPLRDRSAGKVFVLCHPAADEQGRLSLGEYDWGFCWISIEQIDGAVTVEQLLTHTSGIPDYFDESVLDDSGALWTDYPNYKIRSNRDLLPLFIDKPMSYPRGSRFQYNNSGYVMLALLLERLCGQAFDQVLNERIFIPCGMCDTGYFELDRLPARCANHYIFDEPQKTWRTNIFSVDAKGTGARRLRHSRRYLPVLARAQVWQTALARHDPEHAQPSQRRRGRLRLRRLAAPVTRRLDTVYPGVRPWCQLPVCLRRRTEPGGRLGQQLRG